MKNVFSLNFIEKERQGKTEIEKLRETKGRERPTDREREREREKKVMILHMTKEKASMYLIFIIWDCITPRSASII